MTTVDVFGMPYAVTDYAQASQVIINAAVENKSMAVFAMPVHGVIELNTNQDFKQAILQGDLIVPDGQPIVWTMNAFHSTGLKDRVTGPILMHWVLEQCNEKALRVYLYGGKTEQVLKDLVTSIKRNYPAVEVCGAYREAMFGETTLTVDEINNARPHIVFCGFGCPAQEIWIAKNKSQLSAVLMGVGAAFDFHSGHAKHAPNWMQKIGMEWFYRLVHNPKRLWKRYLYTNSYFLILIVKGFFKKNFKG